VTLDEWHAVLATELATPNQRGAIMHEFGRLGFGEGDRAERLAICAALAGLENLDSTADLTMGQAGQVYRALLDIGDRAELLDTAERGGEDQAAEGEADEKSAGPTLIEAIGQLIIAFAIWRYKRPEDSTRSSSEAETGDDGN
jgi:hypothetical protein